MSSNVQTETETEIVSASVSSSSSSVDVVSEPGVFNELQKLINALKGNPFYQEASYILHWRDPIRSFLIFGIINTAYFLLTFANYSILTLFNYCALALLAVSFAYANGIVLWSRYIQGIQIENPLISRWANSKLVVSRTVIEKHVDTIYNFVNALLDISRDIYHCGFPLLSLKFAFLFFAFSQIGKYICGPTLLYLSVLSLFAVPRIYEEKKIQIDRCVNIYNEKSSFYCNKIHDQASLYSNLVLSKLPRFDKRKAQ